MPGSVGVVEGVADGEPDPLPVGLGLIVDGDVVAGEVVEEGAEMARGAERSASAWRLSSVDTE